MTVAGEDAVTYDYDDADRLTEVAQSTATVSLAYDDAGRLSTTTLPNGIVEGYAYDDASQLTGITYALGQTTLGDLAYSYDLAGHRSGVTGSWARTGIPQAVTSASYDDANELTSWDGTSLSYDSDGNLTGDGTNTYSWNGRGELSGISGSQSASFAYDAFGRRIEKTIGATTTDFLYDGLNVVQEQDGSGNPSANLLTGFGLDQTYTRTDSSGTENFLTDALGSTAALADNSGTVATTYTYEPFGKASAGGASSSNSFQFTGRESDGADLSYYRARYYSPNMQRFVSEDPLRFAGSGTNLFAYSLNQPTLLVDPLGLCGFNPGGLLDALRGRCGFPSPFYPLDFLYDHIIDPIYHYLRDNWGDLNDSLHDFLNSNVGKFLVGCIVGGTGGVVAYNSITGGAPLWIPGYGWASEGLAALGGCLIGGGTNVFFGIPNPIRRG